MNPLPEIRFTQVFQQNRQDLPAAAELFGYLAEVVVQGTHPFRMALPMQKEMPLEEIIAPALAEAEQRHCILDKLVFLSCREMAKGEKMAARVLDPAQ